MPKADLGKVVGEQGPEGPVAQGTMLKDIYDPNGKSRDVFAYADAAKQEAKDYAAPAAHAAQHGASGSDPVTPAAIGAIPSTEKGVAGGVAALGEDGKVPSGQLPSLDFVAKAGDTMTGNLNIQRDYPQITLKSPLAGRDSYVSYVGSEKILYLMNRLDANNRQGLYITPETSPLSNALRLMRVVDGNASYYNFIHTGNLSDIGIARIATGSYVGTGTYGESNPTILSAGFPPKALFIVREGHEIFCSQYEWEESGIWIQGARGFSQTRNNPATVVTANGNTLSMYSTSSSYDQLNVSGETYHYVMLG